MTNGEKFKEVFKISQVDDCDLNIYVWLPIHDAIEIPLEWWNAEYEEPTTKNDSEHNLCDSCINYKCEFQSGIVRTKCAFYMPPQHSSELEKNSKKLEKDFGELNCISRVDAQTEIEMNASRYTIAKERGGMGQVEWSDQLIKVSDAVDIIRNLPAVAPQEPRIITCSECKYYRDKGNKNTYCTKRLNVASVIDRYREPNFYCADAVLREVEE